MTDIPRGSNRLEATCATCGLRVAPGKGSVNGRVGVNWRVVHFTCIPVLKTKLPEGLEYDL